VLLEDVLREEVSRVLDLGTGDGHLIDVVRSRWPEAAAVGLDFSEPMLAEGRRRFEGDPGMELRDHDLMRPLPADLDDFDAVVSSLALHHLPHERKRELYREVHGMLRPGGLFCNLDVVEAPEPELHEYAQTAFGFLKEEEDKSDRPAPLAEELGWLREAGFRLVDCYWKWLELALVAGVRP
jgi:tRNA (cmo5U34)-methyltransferase